MKKLLTLLAFSGITVVMVNCSSSKSSMSTAKTAPDMTSSEKVAVIKKNFTGAQLEEGKAIMTASCQKCHKIKEPETRTVEKLEKVLPSMIQKANLSEKEGALVRAYMLAHAKLS